MNILIKTFKHLHTVNKHRWYVFKYSIKAGIPFRGLVHDLSKYSPTEFFESVKYFDGHKSPLTLAKLDKGYSEALLHHRGRNKHHPEYWEDEMNGERVGIFMPYKYIVESVCDKISATKVYNGKNFNPTQILEIWKKEVKKNPTAIHPGVVEFYDTVLAKIAEDGIDAALKPKYLKQTYNNIKNKHTKKNKS